MAKKWPRYEYWKGNDGLWFWHKVSRNGQVTSDGGEGYVTSGNVRRALRNQGVENDQMVRVEADT